MKDRNHEIALSAPLSDLPEWLTRAEADGDAATFRYLESIGIGPGWHCLEVGPGSASVVRWMANKVGLTGHVTAVDVDTSFLRQLRAPNVEIRQIDVTSDEFPRELGAFDVVHCRNLIIYQQDPRLALRQLGSALRPGGWLVAEEPDYSTARAVDLGHPLGWAYDCCVGAWKQFGHLTGRFDALIGSALPQYIDQLGLESVGNEGLARICSGTDPWSQVWLKNWKQFEQELIESGYVDAVSAATMCDAMGDGAFRFRTQTTQAVWGRKPAVLRSLP